MGQTKNVYAKPKERAHVVCFDASAKSWEVCFWSSEAGWVRPDGGAPQFSPSTWVTCSGDPSGAKKREILSVFASAQPILTAPKSDVVIILLDDISCAWEVGSWSSEILSWTQIDGKRLRIFPTHWASATSICSDIMAKPQASHMGN